MYDYSSNRQPILLREYGRHIQKLVEITKAIKDKTERTAHARGILRIMVLLDANNKHSGEYIRKRWDDLFILADYSLDVDSPDPMPAKGLLNKKLQQPAYIKKPLKFRNYGRNVERLIQKAITIEDPEEQEKMVIDIVKLMKTFSNEWNNDNVDCETLLANLKHISGDKLTVDAEKIKTQVIFSAAGKYNPRASKTNRGTNKRKKSS